MNEIIEKILVNACGSKDVLEPDMDLIESGLLDSLAFITLLAELEDIGVEIQPTEVNKNDFSTLSGIMEIVNKFSDGKSKNPSQIIM